MKSKLVFLMLVTLLVLNLTAGCGSSNSTTQSDNNQNVSQQSANTEGNNEKFDYPTRAIQMIVGWGAGGGTDVFARAIAQPASEIMDQPVTVVNMEGASGAIAGDYVLKQPADGYTIWAEGSNYPINVAMGKTPHGLDEYIPIARIQQDTGTIQVRKESQFKTIEDFVAYAKQNPGKITVGGSGAAGFDEVVIAKFEKAAGIDLNYVPYESAGEMHSALLGGHIDAEFEEYGPVVKLIEDGSVRVLMAFAESRSDRFPDVPASKEKGWDVTDGIWRGLFVKAGTPQEIVDYLRDVFREAKDSESYKKFEHDNVLDLRAGYLDSDDFKAKVESDIEMYKKVLKDLGYIN